MMDIRGDGKATPEDVKQWSLAVVWCSVKHGTGCDRPVPQPGWSKAGAQSQYAADSESEE